MRTQLLRNSGSATIHRLAGSGCATALAGPGREADPGWLEAILAILPRRSGLVAVALLTALGPIATARAITLSDLVLTGPVAGAGLPWSGLEVTVTADLVTGSHFYQPDFGAAGRTVMGPFAAADGKSSGIVFRWTGTARDPAYLFSVDSLFLQGVGSWTPRDQIPWALPNLGVVPGGNLSVFETGAIDVISWNFLEFSCALLALRVEDYVRLRRVLEPGEFDLNSRIPEVGQQLRAVPDPETFLLMGQGLFVLALFGPRRLRSHRAPWIAKGSVLSRPWGSASRRARLPGR